MRLIEQHSLAPILPLARRLPYRNNLTANAAGLRSISTSFAPKLNPEVIACNLRGEDAPSPDEGNPL
jgi:hypothetical protein